MAKKTSNKARSKDIAESLPAEARFLKQPANITFLSGDMSAREWDMMIELVDALQDNINHSLTTGMKSLFADDEYFGDTVNVQIPLARITENPEYYRYVEEVCNSLMKVVVPIDKVKKDGTPYVELSHIVDYARIPKFESSDKKQYRKGYIEISLHHKTVDNVYSLTRYTKYIKNIAKNSKSVYTKRIYMFITGYKFAGEWKVNYRHLHSMLGFSKEKKGSGGQVEYEILKYPNYRQFKQKVLKGAEEELRTLADEGLSDCYFDFEETYPADKKRGEPEKIIFHIHTTQYGKQIESSLQQNSLYIEIEKVLRNEYDFNTSSIKQVFALVSEGTAQLCLDKIAEIGEWMKEHADSIEDKKKYMLVSLKNALKEEVEIVEPLQDETPPQPSQGREKDGHYLSPSSLGQAHSEEEDALCAGNGGDEEARAMFEEWIQKIPTDWRSAFKMVGTEITDDKKELVVEMPVMASYATFIELHGQDMIKGVKVQIKG